MIAGMATSQKSQSTGAGYDDWPDKETTAQLIGCSTKLVEQLAQEGKLQMVKARRGNSGPARALYHPKDVKRVAAERNPEASTFVLPPAGKQDTVRDVIRRPEPGFDAVFATLRAGIDEWLGKARPVELKDKTYLTLAEAAEFAGLPKEYIRRRAVEGSILAIKTGAGWRIKRAELERL